MRFRFSLSLHLLAFIACVLLIWPHTNLSAFVGAQWARLISLLRTIIRYIRRTAGRILALELVGLLVGGATLMQVREYSLALVMWLAVAIGVGGVLWPSTDGKLRKMLSVVSATMVLIGLAAWTVAYKGDDPWTNFQRLWAKKTTVAMKGGSESSPQPTKTSEHEHLQDNLSVADEMSVGVRRAPSSSIELKPPAYMQVDDLKLVGMQAPMTPTVEVYYGNYKSHAPADLRFANGKHFFISDPPTEEIENKLFSDFAASVPKALTTIVTLDIDHGSVFQISVPEILKGDVNNDLIRGGKWLYVMGGILWSDPTGEHRKGICRYLQPFNLNRGTPSRVNPFDDWKACNPDAMKKWEKSAPGHAVVQIRHEAQSQLSFHAEGHAITFGGGIEWREGYGALHFTIENPKSSIQNLDLSIQSEGVIFEMGQLGTIPNVEFHAVGFPADFGDRIKTEKGGSLLFTLKDSIRLSGAKLPNLTHQWKIFCPRLIGSTELELILAVPDTSQPSTLRIIGKYEQLPDEVGKPITIDAVVPVRY